MMAMNAPWLSTSCSNASRSVLFRTLFMQMQHMPGEPDIEIGYRLLIPVVHVGALIGRGGEAIAQLRQRTGARVKVHDAHDSEQPLHLRVHPNS